MIKKSLFSTNELLMAVVPAETGEPVLRYARLSGRRIVETGQGNLPRFKGPTRAAVYSLESYFEQVDLTVSSVKLLPLVARRHVDTELVFDDASYRLRARCRQQRERTIAADIAAMPEQDLETAVSLLPLKEQPCLQMVPLELAIAALVNRVNSDPIIVFWEKGGVLLSLLVMDGMVLTRMRERVTDSDRESIITRAEAGLRAGAARLAEKRDIALTLFTGELAGYALEGDEKPVEIFEKKLRRVYRTGGKVQKEAVLRDPELYGLPFVADEWNFLEANYRTQVRSWQLARPAAALASIAGILFAVYGGVQHLYALSIASDFDQQRDQLNGELAAYEKIRPSDEAMAYVRDRLQLQQQSVSEVRLDRMLDWMTHLLPEGVVISGLEVKPTPLPRQRSREAPVEYPAGEKPFDVTVNIVLADTVLDDAEASASEVVRRLSQRLTMVDSRLQVPAPQPNVRRNVVLVVKAQARAVNFS